MADPVTDPKLTNTSRPSGLRAVPVSRVREKVATLIVEANYDIGDDLLDALRFAKEEEQSEQGRDVLVQLIENYEYALEQRVPACQDTGLPVVFLRIGQDVHFVGGSLREAIQEGVREGTRRGYLRASVVADPIRRTNSGDNTPAVIHTEIVEGDEVHILLACKGFGSENKSSLKLLTPAQGLEGVKRFVVDTVDKAGAQACPPFIVGVGLGGSFEKAAILAKQAVLRPVSRRHPDPDVARLEIELKEAINRLGIGPQGFGGVVTALAVNIETYGTHIASLPVAVNIGCHSNRHKEGWV